MRTKVKCALALMMLATIMLAAPSCNDCLDIHQNYAFDLVTMPYPKKVVNGETVEIRCTIVKEGDYKDTKYSIRYFQIDGKGELRLDDGQVLTPNDPFPLTADEFRLYYTSHCTDRQNLEIYVTNSFGQTVQKSFSFSNENAETEE
jgi:hypothetical protein